MFNQIIESVKHQKQNPTKKFKNWFIQICVYLLYKTNISLNKTYI